MKKAFILLSVAIMGCATVSMGQEPVKKECNKEKKECCKQDKKCDKKTKECCKKDGKKAELSDAKSLKEDRRARGRLQRDTLGQPKQVLALPSERTATKKLEKSE